MIMKKARGTAWWKKISVLLMFGSLISGCATIINGTRQNVLITTFPTQAKVVVDNREYVSPIVIGLKRNNKHTITVSKSGYMDASTSVFTSPTLTIYWNLMLFAGALPGFAIDLITGASHDLEPQVIHIVFNDGAD